MKIRPLYIYIYCLFFSFITANMCCAQWNGDFAIASSSGKYAYPSNGTPGNLVVTILPVSGYAPGLSYQWEKSTMPLSGFAAAASATSTPASYVFSAPLSQTTYFRLKVTDNLSTNITVYSNVLKIQLVSANWENQNYTREHTVLTPGVTTWQAVDQLPVTQNLQINADGLPAAQKKQVTTYLDGLGRSVEKVAREIATPPSGNSVWGDFVSFDQYDEYGRQPKQYLPYTAQYTTTTGTESGKYKASPVTAQASYYSTNYSETNPYSLISFDVSPLQRVNKQNASGSSWASSAGTTATYEVNDITDNVQILTIGYAGGSVPSRVGTYPANTLIENTAVDENGKKIVTFTNSLGQLVLTKTQIDDAPLASTPGWICVYSIYDDFGLLRYKLQPEAVKYFDANNWDFTTTTAQTVLKELCFRYEYDEKGRNILKKAPGADVLNMLYDTRDRVVFMQDGNQAMKSPAEWTLNLYDDLDRPTLTALYHTTKTISQLQTDINSAVTNTTVTVNSSTQANLVLNNRDVSISLYEAANSITINPGFTSAVNDNYIAQINNTTTTGVVNVLNNPVASTDLNDPSITTILKYAFYDDYSYNGAKAFDAVYGNTTAYSTSDVNVIPITNSNRVLTMATGTKTRVLGTNTFLVSTVYYDEKGRTVQTTADNIKQGTDVVTLQYHFDGRILSSHSKHTTANSGYTAFGTLTKYFFDRIGRVSSIQKKYGANAFKTVENIDLDDMGRVKTKHLDPNYSGSNDLESLAYSYNMHGQLTGINKDYALKSTGYDKWAHYFGLYLGYDNKDGFFSTGKLDGHAAGMVWSTQGDNAQRRYDFTYDNAGRFTSAIFKERVTPADAWDNSKMDFSVTGTGGAGSKITYDLNGNLLSMVQRGVVPGSTAPVDIDKLTYSYTTYSNKLLKVQDATTQASTNGKSGDFSDGTNGSNNDYVYDRNGNVVIDLNKNIKDLGNTAGNGISYNFLDKPELVRISGKGTIKIVYDAGGNRLQKVFIPENGGAAVTTTYINEFVYIGSDVKYINFEEGRLRVITPVSQGNGYDALVVDGSNTALPGGKEGVFDFFIRDYQQSVRMILTEETHDGSNKCTMESSRAAAEDPVFGQTGAANEVEQTRFAVNQIPLPGWQNSSIGSSVSKLSALAGSTKTGPNVLLKVMAGDEVTATTQYFYLNNVTNSAATTSLPQDVLNSLVQAISGSNATSSLVKGAATTISTQLNGLQAFKNLAEPDATNTSGNNPKAYLTVLFFDERFNLVSDGSSYFKRVDVSNAGNNNASIPPVPTKAPKNGYAFVYLSNESNEPVYFDNFNVRLNRGRIIEEDHYYAFGLKIAAISSTKAADVNEGNIDNKNLYYDKELLDDADLDWYDYGFRNYDAQIGRFIQIDPLAFTFNAVSPYQYAFNEPIAFIDKDGLGGDNELAPVTVYAKAKPLNLRPVAFRMNFSPTLFFVHRTDFFYSNGHGSTFVTHEYHDPVIKSYLGEDWSFAGSQNADGWVDDWRLGMSQKDLQARYDAYWRVFWNKAAHPDVYLFRHGKASVWQTTIQLWNSYSKCDVHMNHEKANPDFFTNVSQPEKAYSDALKDDVAGPAMFNMFWAGGGILRSMGSSAAEITVYRVTARGVENAIYKETGYIMSDAAQEAYNHAYWNLGMAEGSPEAINYALEQSKIAHEANLRYFGSMEEYTNAHMGGTEFKGAAPRSLISFTDDPGVLPKFNQSGNGIIYSTSTPGRNLIPQIGGGESELLIKHMIKIP